MEKTKNPFVFTSVFYAQEKWHELLPVIRQSIYGQPGLRNQLGDVYVFFSSHRGSSIRLALKYKDPDQKTSHKNLIQPIQEFLKKNPCGPQPLRFPITGFFSDFPNNEIKYNLYNERVIADDLLGQFQIVLSQFLLVYFEDRPVDDEGLFSLVNWLQDAILNGLSDSELTKDDLFLQLITELQRKDFDSRVALFELKGYERVPVTPGFSPEPDVDVFFLWFGYAAHMLYSSTGNLIQSYFLILHIIREHLFKIPREFFLDSLLHLAHSLEPVHVAQSRPVL